MDELNLDLSARVKVCCVLNKFIKQIGVQKITEVVVATELFSTLSKQIVALQMSLRLEGQHASLDFNDNEFLIKEYENLNEYSEDLLTLQLTHIVHENEIFEKRLQDRVDLLLDSLIRSLSDQSVDK